jgi:medium-chain acyl-[acyl-carrier-protein] hydrolase
MGEKGIFEETFRIRSFETDAGQHLTFISLSNYILEAAGRHARQLKLDIPSLLRKGLTWMLARFRVQVDSYPCAGEKIRIQTWPSGVKRLFALRDFILYNERENRIGRAYSAWLAIDLKTHRPVPCLELVRNILVPREAKNDQLKKLSAVPGRCWKTSFRILYSDMDINQHVNSVSYIKWMIETIPYEIQKSHVIKEIVINYISEALYGENVVCMTAGNHENKDLFSHSIVNQDETKELVRASSLWHISA